MPPTWPVAVTAAITLATWGILGLGAGVAPSAAPVDTFLFGALLDTLAVALALVVAVLCVLRWRLVGDAAALWLGAGALLLGAVTIGSAPLVSLLRPRAFDTQVLSWLTPASRVVALWLLWRAARTPQVDATLGLARVLARAVVVLLCGVALVAAAPGLARFVASSGDVLPGVTPVPWGSLALGSAWLALAVLHGRRGSHERHPLHLWFAAALLAMGLGEMLWLAAPVETSLWATGPALLRAYGLMAALAGATRELSRTFAEQRGQLFETIATGLTAEARVRAEQAAAQERAHEARNALTAIEGATRTLESYHERLDGQTRASLAQAITTEIARLQRLIALEGTGGHAVEFAVADTLAGVVVGARAQGLDVAVQVPPDLVVSGRPAELAEVVQNLIENARRYAPGSPVTVRAERDRAGVLIRVEDRGPGVPPDERERIFTRGFRGRGARASEGSGLGLYICARLVREQRGELWVDDRPGGGSSFAVWLPAPAQTSAARSVLVRQEAAPHEGEDVVEGGNVYPIFGGLPAHQRGGAVAEGDHHIGHDASG